jgi:hypothetical protein
MLCDPGLILGGTEDVGSSFHVLRYGTHFRWYRVHRVPFSFSNALGPVLYGFEGVGSSFHVLRSRTHFRWYRGHSVEFSCFVLSEPFSAVRRVQFSCFALPDSFPAVLRAPNPVFMFCAPILILGASV